MTFKVTKNGIRMHTIILSVYKLRTAGQRYFLTRSAMQHFFSFNSTNLAQKKKYLDALLELLQLHINLYPYQLKSERENETKVLLCADLVTVSQGHGH